MKVLKSQTSVAKSLQKEMISRPKPQTRSRCRRSCHRPALTNAKPRSAQSTAVRQAIPVSAAGE